MTGAIDPLTGLSGKDRVSERDIRAVAREQATGTVTITSRQNENDDEYGVVGRNYDGTYEETLKSGRVQQFALSHSRFDQEQAYHGD